MAARIVNGDFFRFGKGDEFLRTDYISVSCVNLIVILIGSGVKFKDIAGLVQKLNEFLPCEHDFLRRFVKLRVLQRNFPRFLQGDNSLCVGDCALLVVQKLIEGHKSDLVCGQAGFV